MILPPFSERKGRSAGAELAALRRSMAEAVATGAWRTDSPPSELTIGGVRSLSFIPEAKPRALVLHLHGGGFRMGCPEMVGPFAAALAKQAQVEVVCPAYRLAPEHPFPAALNDAWHVLAALRCRHAGPLIISGDSAGGGLAASLTVLCAAQGVPPNGLVLLSPWLDLTVTSGSYEGNAATDPLFSRTAAKSAAELYLQGVSPKDPLASPLHAALAGFPPTLISVGEGEVLVDDACRFQRALATAGAQAELSLVPGMEHVAVTRGLERAGAAVTFETIVDFIAYVRDGRPVIS